MSLSPRVEGHENSGTATSNTVRKEEGETLSVRDRTAKAGLEQSDVVCASHMATSCDGRNTSIGFTFLCFYIWKVWSFLLEKHRRTLSDS